MAIALYNPRTYTGNRGKVENTTDVKRFVWSHAYWDLKVGETKKFPDEVAKAMLSHCEFLIEATPKNIAKIKEEQLEKKFKCDQCAFQTDYKMALVTHQKTHGVDADKAKELEDIETAQPSGKFQPPQGKKLTIEEQEGIPKSGKDQHGVEWYGEGVETDRP